MAAVLWDRLCVEGREHLFKFEIIEYFDGFADIFSYCEKLDIYQFCFDCL